MDDDTTAREAPPADEAWVHDWAQAGIAALERYLEKHARFAAFLLERRGVASRHGGVAQS